MRGRATGGACVGALCVRKGGLADRGKTPENRGVAGRSMGVIKRASTKKGGKNFFYEISKKVVDTLALRDKNNGAERRKGLTKK